jgi:ABC-type bacteriocin/lantibiotic exporter with double-glycine peptidase domain
VGLSRIRLTLSGATVSAALAAVFSLVNLAVLFLLDSALAGVAVLLVAAMLGGVGLLASRALREERRLAGLAGVLSGRMLQWLGGIARLRATGTESRALWVVGADVRAPAAAPAERAAGPTAASSRCRRRSRPWRA